MPQHTLSVETHHPDDWINITQEVTELLRKSGETSGVVTVFVPHTTAAITVQENADPPLKQDINQVLARLFPRDESYRHCEDNAASHMKAVMVGPSIQVPFHDGKLSLGTWQGIYLCEFDGPRERQVVVHF